MSKQEVLNCEKASRGALAFEIIKIVTTSMGATSIILATNWCSAIDNDARNNQCVGEADDFGANC